jgi:MYXO-CTERM domain-containing protein
LAVFSQKGALKVRRFFALGVTLAVALLLAPAPAKAVLFTVTFDENGFGLIVNSEHTFVPSSNMPDPFDPGNGLKPLVYDLGIRNPGLVSGDVVILEPGIPGAGSSDVFRFWNNPDTHHQWAIFYSDIGVLDNDKADVGLPPTLMTNVLTLTEVDLGGGLSGVTYQALFGSGLPGTSLVTGQDAIYNLISDSPEPSTLAIAGLGALGLFASRLWRRR